MAANIFINGIELTAPNFHSIKDFFLRMNGAGAQVRFSGGRNKILEVQVQGDFVQGVLFSDTQQSSVLTLTVVDGRAIVEIHELSADKPRHDFTFFRINLINGRGLYTQYRGSGGVTSFAKFLNTLYREHVLSKVTELEASSVTPSKSKRKEYSELRRSQITSQYLAPDHMFSKELARLTRIDHFNWSEPTIRDMRFRPVKHATEMTQCTVSFHKDTSLLQDLYGFVSQFVADNGIETGKVIGKNEHDKIEEIPINPDALSFATASFDKVAIEDNLSLTGRFNGPFCRYMHSLIEQHKSIFTASANVS